MLHVFNMTKFLFLVILKSKIRNPISTLVKCNLEHGPTFQSNRIGTAYLLSNYLMLLVMLSNKNYSN